MTCPNFTFVVKGRVEYFKPRATAEPSSMSIERAVSIMITLLPGESLLNEVYHFFSFSRVV